MPRDHADPPAGAPDETGAAALLTGVSSLPVNDLSAHDAGGPPEWVHLIPAGTFSGRDGRGPYRLDAEAVAAAFARHGADLPIDYDHQSLSAEEKAGPVPAAGWITAIEAREDGLWARVRWTERAAARSLRARADSPDPAQYVPIAQHRAVAEAMRARMSCRTACRDRVGQTGRAASHHCGAPHGYATPITEAGFLLSGGQRQRLAIARALYGEPCLVVLDEPEAHLDAEGEATVIAAIASVRARGGAVVFTTHRRALVAAADRRPVLSHGLIERAATTAAVLADLERPPIRLVPRAREAA